MAASHGGPMLIFSSLIFLAAVLVVGAISGEIQSCPGCKLNHLPELKRFLKQPGNIDAYDIKVNFIWGRTPELFIKDDSGTLVEKIDLTQLSTIDQIHKLLQSKGFERKYTGTSSDNGRSKALDSGRAKTKLRRTRSE